MIVTLIHSSKTMRQPHEVAPAAYQQPQFLTEARELANYVQSLSPTVLADSMKISNNLAQATHDLWQEWTDEPAQQRPAIDSFSGDIYSGLQVASLSAKDREFANKHLLILSGLYGALRPLDSIAPYRLEMGYRPPSEQYKNLYRFWGDSLAKIVPAKATIINASAVEYTRNILPHLQNRVITPKFLTINPKTNQPTFVAVHSKIARGALARWLIINRVSSATEITKFSELGYKYEPTTSTPDEPVFITKNFGGKGLSVR